VSSYWITPGSLLEAKTDVVGSGLNFSSIVRKKQIILFISRESVPSVKEVFIYKYIQSDKVEHMICEEEKFRKFFKVIRLVVSRNGNSRDKTRKARSSS